jgi:hypothetical protein
LIFLLYAAFATLAGGCRRGERISVSAWAISGA